MQVLNWVTRRFLNNVQSCIVVLPDEDMEDNHVSSKYDGVDETKRPMLEDWDDSLLAIGTLAIGPLETGNFEIVKKIQNTSDLNDHNLDYNGFENTEKIPLMNMMTLFNHEFEKEIVSKTKTTQEQVINVVVDLNDNDDIKDEWQAMKRVTLADLLLQDSDQSKFVKQLADNKQLHQANVLSKDVITMTKPSVKMINPTFRAKRGLAKAKKLLKEDLSPVKKVNQLLKRMMKKKIYPDMGGKIIPDTDLDMDMNIKPRSLVIGNPSNEDIGSTQL